MFGAIQNDVISSIHFMKDYYKILGVSNNADYLAIKKAYRKLALKYHPDINKSPNASKKFIEIKEAYETLIDKNSRTSYDFALKEFYASQKINKKESEKKEKGTKIPFWVAWVVIALIRSASGSNTNNTTSNSQHKYIVDQEIFETKATKPSDIPFMNNDNQSRIVSDPVANRFLTELSKSDLIAKIN